MTPFEEQANHYACVLDDEARHPGARPVVEVHKAVTLGLRDDALGQLIRSDLSISVILGILVKEAVKDGWNPRLDGVPPLKPG